MTGPLGDVLFVVGIAVIAAAVGLGLGIFLLAPRISRAIDRAEPDEEARDPRD